MPNKRQHLNNYLSKVTLIVNKRQHVMSASIDRRIPPPQVDERNRSYLIRCAALGMKPTLDEMDVDIANSKSSTGLISTPLSTSKFTSA